ncbi:hypothetical protein LCGC14_2130950, partial [marine sediment metagenome]
MCKKLVCLVSVVLVLGLVVDASAVLKKGPYLLWPGTNTEMTVLWQLNSTTTCTLEWGLNTNYSTGSVQTSEYGGDNQHKYTISGLSPGTKYFYRVTAGAEQPTGSFRAAPSSSATAVKFLAYGDTRTNPDKHDLVAEEVVNTYQADSSYQTMVLFTGDYTSSHSETAWTNEFFPTSYTNIRELQANLPIQGALGNHELFWSPGGYKTESNMTIPPKYFPFPFEAWSYWSFDYGPALIIIADQYAVGTYPNNTIGSTQLAWIENELSTSNREWKFIVLHEPGYGGGQSSENSEVMNYIQPLCEEYGVDIVFAGHHHHYARCVKNGIKHMTLGGGGAPLSGPEQKPGVEYREMTYHFAKIEIDGTTLNFEARKPDGSLIDSFSLYHAVDNDPPTPDPMTWATVPYSTGATSIAMVATTASDSSGVEYFFNCVGGGHDSIWQDQTSYEDTALDPKTYCYEVKARDKSPAQNETGVSSAELATTDALTT